MSEPLSIPHVTTTPKPFGVDVEWKWPGGCAVLELQCLHEDGRLMKERIFWPATVCLISGLKAGERLQVRLRPVTADGSTRDWQAADWIDGVSSVDTEEILQALDEKICNSDAFNVLKGGWSFEKNGTLIINNAQVFVTDAKIDDDMLSTNYSAKLNINGTGKKYAAGMTIGAEDGQSKVVFKADSFKSHKAASFIIENAVATSVKTKASLSDEMKRAVIDAVNDTIRKMLKPGGVLWNARSR
ncbi:TPA: phage tail tip fiber protein [Enterobacter hormaechei]